MPAPALVFFWLSMYVYHFGGVPTTLPTSVEPVA
jgi:hypothetical protein